MALTAEVEAGDIEAAKAEANNFKAIPAGNYEATIAGTEVKAYGDESDYRGKRYLNLKLRIVEGSEVGAKRVFFLKVPLFGRWNPSAKYPKGYPTNYFEFFNLVGASDEAIAAGRGLPEPTDWAGKRVSIYLSLKPADKYNDSEHNEVGRISASKGGPAEATGGTAVDEDVWASAAPAAESAAEDVWSTPEADPELQAAASSGAGF